MADMKEDRPANLQTKFRIGSVTKQFTAAAILSLVDQNKLSLNQTLDQFVPDFERGADVTIHQLLNHTSGIPSYTDDLAFFDSIDQPIDELELISIFNHLPFSFEPGTDYHYNNSGYFLLGHIVRKVSGMPLGEFLQETFFEPLEMNSTGFYSASLDLENEALGYSYEDGQFKTALNWDMSRIGGAGALYSTAEDLMKWNEALFAGRVISDGLLEVATTPGRNDYGYGLVISRNRGVQSVGHGGGLHGFLSSLIRYPALNTTIVVLHNGSPAFPGIDPSALSSEMAEIFLWNDFEPRTVNVLGPKVPVEQMQKYLGRYDYGAAVMETTLQDDQLFVQLTGQQKFKVYPADETKFFLKAVQASVEFLLDDQGEYSSVRHTQNGQSFVAKRLPNLETVELSNQILDRYVGDYDYGPARMTIRRDGGRLVAQMTGQPEFELFAVNERTFVWKVVEAKITFKIDDNGDVEGATHHQGGQEIEVKRLKSNRSAIHGEE